MCALYALDARCQQSQMTNWHLSMSCVCHASGQMLRHTFEMLHPRCTLAQSGHQASSRFYGMLCTRMTAPMPVLRHKTQTHTGPRAQTSPLWRWSPGHEQSRKGGGGSARRNGRRRRRESLAGQVHAMAFLARIRCMLVSPRAAAESAVGQGSWRRTGFVSISSMLPQPQHSASHPARVHACLGGTALAQQRWGRGIGRLRRRLGL